MDISKKLDKVVYKAMALPLLISLIVSTIVSLSNFHWSIYIPVIGTALIGSVFELNKHYLIRTNKEENGKLTLTYYNFLDKIVRESIGTEQLIEQKITRNNKLVTLRFMDNRELKLHCLEGITEQAR